MAEQAPPVSDRRDDFAEVPTTGTEAARTFWLRQTDDAITAGHLFRGHDDVQHLIRMHSSVPHLLRAKADAVRHQTDFDDEGFRQALNERPLDEILMPGLRPVLARHDAMAPRAQEFLFEVVLCRFVDNFLAYLADILAEVFRARPETLRSSEQVTVEQVLAHGSLDEFVAWFADRRVNSMSYKGLDGIEDFIRRRFGLVLERDAEVHQRVKEVIAVRNLIVHRRGVIDRRFVEDVGEQFGHLGEGVNPASMWRSRHVDAPSGVVRAFDPAVAKKFDLSMAQIHLPEYWPSEDQP